MVEIGGREGRRVPAAMLALILLGVVGACGGSASHEPGDADERVPLEALPERMADAGCRGIAECCNAAAIPFDLATCKATAKARFALGLMDQSTATIRYDARAAAACVTAYGEYFAHCIVGESVATVCTRIYTGAVALGEACTDPYECAPVEAGTVRCLFDSESARGVCAPPSSYAEVHGRLGDACVGSCGREDCALPVPREGDPPPTPFCYAEDGLYCDYEQKICLPLAAVGSSCQVTPCVSGAFCSRDLVCTAPLTDGADCLGNRQCSSGRCVRAVDEPARATCGRLSLATPAACGSLLEW